MVEKIKKNSEVILKHLSKYKNITMTELKDNTKLSKDKIRIAIAFLLGAKKIVELKIGMCKTYNLK